MQVLASATIGDKIVEILSLNGVASENETSYTPPHHSKLGFCCFFSAVRASTALHGVRKRGSFIFLFIYFPMDYFFYVLASLGFIAGRAALGTLGKLCITTSFGAVDLLAAELYPTVVR